MKITSFAEIEPELVERAHRIVWCNVATIDTRNRPRSRILHPIWDRGAGWVITRRATLKARHLARNPYLSVAYVADPVRPLYIDCTGVWDDDPATMLRIWDLFKQAPPPLGYDPGAIFPAPEHPDCGLLKLTPWRVQLDDMTAPAERRIWQVGAAE